MSEKNKPRPYQPEDIRVGWGMTIFMAAVIVVGFHFILTGYWKVPLKEYLMASFMFTGGIFFLLFLLYHHYAYCMYLEITEDEITGKNSYKKKMRVIKFNEIEEIWITKRILVIHLKDIHGNRLGISFQEEFIPVLKELLEKSVNCTRIDFKYDYIMKHKLSKKLPEIKPLLDKRLAEIKAREMGLDAQQEENNKYIFEVNRLKEYTLTNHVSGIKLAILLIIIIALGFEFIFKDDKEMSLFVFVIFLFLAFFSPLVVWGIFYYLRLIYNSIEYGSNIKTTEYEMIGLNDFNVRLGSIKFNELKEIWTKKNKPILHLKDINGKGFGIIFRNEFVPLLKEILEKSENCTKIDINYNYFVRQKYLRQLSDIKPILDKRLAEIKERNLSQG